MLVDPATGMPIESRPDGPLGAEMTMDALDRVGYSQERVPLIYDMLASVPGAATSTAWNMNRVSNTITGGGGRLSGRGLSRLSNHIPGEGGFFSQGIAQTMNPARFFRLTSPGNIDPPGSSRMYSPFGFASSIGNRAFSTVTGRTGMAAANKYLGMGTEFDTTTDAFSRGTFGRVAAMASMGQMSERRFARKMPNIAKAVTELNADAGANLTKTLAGFSSMGDDAARLATRGAYTGALGSTITGQVSGRVAGYFAGSQAARLGTAEGLRLASSGAFKIGAERAISSYASSPLTRMAGSRGAAVAMKAAGPIGTIMLVRDLAMMGGKIMGAGARTVADAGRSLMSPLNKGVMGAQFKDNSVAATARQRGVAAIANSRLNMRSVMGHEAASMAAYYG